MKTFRWSQTTALYTEKKPHALLISTNVVVTRLYTHPHHLTYSTYSLFVLVKLIQFICRGNEMLSMICLIDVIILTRNVKHIEFIIQCIHNKLIYINQGKYGHIVGWIHGERVPHIRPNMYAKWFFFMIQGNKASR